jgi:hypothetical protein
VRPILPLPQRVSGSEPFCTVFRKAVSESIDACREQVDPVKPDSLPLEAELAQTRWFRGPLPDVHQPESATGVAFQWEGTSSGPASMARLREEEEE